MRYKLFAAVGVALAAAGVGVGLAAPPAAPAGGGTEWAANLTAIEACSCPMFCQCYFNTQPAAHGGHEHGGMGGGAKHFCRANLAYKINKGHHGATNLDGAKFWIASDLGDDFSKGEMDWAVLYFDKSLTPAQREAIGVVAGKLFPVKWRSFKTAEVKLHRFKGLTDEPVVIRNLPYWGAKRNDGFVMMPNDVEAYRTGPNAFEFKGTNGFMITIDIDADSAPPKAKATGM